MKNLMEKIEQQERKINIRYSAYPQDINEIIKQSDCKAMILYNCFVFGYMQGHKAALAEMKKKARAK